MPLPNSIQLGFIGAGNMATALIQGVVTARVAGPARIWVSDVDEAKMASLSSETGANMARSNAELLEAANVIVLCVKPQVIDSVLEEIAGLATPDHLFVSILAGTKTGKLEEGLAHDGCPKPRVVRAMPNTPALIGMGATGVCAGAFSTESDLKMARVLFEAVGHSCVVKPEQMDLITGLTGSGPAYVFLMIESLIQAGLDGGLSEEDASRMVIQMVAGAGKLALESKVPPAELRRRVTSPKGTTEAGLVSLERAQFRTILADAVEAARRRSVELGGG